MSKEGLADKLSKSMSTVQRWERGTTVPTLEDVLRMEAASAGLLTELRGLARRLEARG